MKPLTIHNTVELGREFLSLVDGNQITLKFRRRKEIFNEEFSCDFSPSLVLLLFHHKINIQTRNLRHLKSYYWIKVVLLRLRIVNLSRTGPVHPHQLINLQWQNFFTKWTRPFYYFDYFFCHDKVVVCSQISQGEQWEVERMFWVLRDSGLSGILFLFLCYSKTLWIWIFFLMCK